jgi:hypothetical protein
MRLTANLVHQSIQTAYLQLLFKPINLFGGTCVCNSSLHRERRAVGQQQLISNNWLLEFAIASTLISNN